MTPIPATEAIVSTRPYDVSGDRAFVVKTWVMAMAPKKQEQRDAYYIGQNPAVEQLVHHKRVLMACLTATPDIIVGFVCFDAESERIYFSHVAREWVGQGVEQGMIDAVVRERAVKVAA